MSSEQRVTIQNYNDYIRERGGRTDGVMGNVLILPEVWSPQLGTPRDVLVYLPPSYARRARRYPVLYMHDGQNLFDHATSFNGLDWHVDETMERLSAEGYEAIVVGVNHGGERRIAEYNPFPGRWHGQGEQYVRFLCDTLKPVIDSHLRTESNREQTGILGSSMGGLISLYAFFSRPEVYGLCGAMSPSIWVGRGAILRYLERAPFVAGRLYLDHGTREPGAEPLRALLLEKGYRPRRDFKYVAERGGQHNESAWARRLPTALRFLLQKEKSQTRRE